MLENSQKSIEKIKNELKKKSFYIAENIIKKNDIKYLINLYKQRFNYHKEIRKSGPWTYKMKDFKRLDLGDSYKNSRFSRCITFCEWNKNNSKFYKIVQPIIVLRNKLSNVKLNQRLNKLFGKKAGINQMRKTYMTDKYSETSKQLNEMAKDFKNMGSSTLQQKIYIKSN